MSSIAWSSFFRSHCVPYLPFYFFFNPIQLFFLSLQLFFSLFIRFSIFSSSSCSIISSEGSSNRNSSKNC